MGTSGQDAPSSPVPSLKQPPAPSHLQLHAGQEALGQSMGVVVQLRYVDCASFLGVDDCGALVAVGSMAGLEVQLGLVVTPRTVRQSHNCLLAVLEALGPWLEGHILDEVTV